MKHEKEGDNRDSRHINTQQKRHSKASSTAQTDEQRRLNVPQGHTMSDYSKEHRGRLVAGSYGWRREEKKHHCSESGHLHSNSTPPEDFIWNWWFLSTHAISMTFC